MAIVTFRFVKPDAWYGHVICWRLKEPWSHVSILFDDCAYSAHIPRVMKLPLDHQYVAYPSREGMDISVRVTQAEEAKMRAWCETQIGKTYDYMSIAGWIMGWSWLQSHKNTYCFEFVRECLQHMGWLKPSRVLIKGNRLIRDIDLLIARHILRSAGDRLSHPIVETRYNLDEEVTPAPLLQQS